MKNAQIGQKEEKRKERKKKRKHVFMYVPFIVNEIVQELIRSHIMIMIRRPFHHLITQNSRLVRMLSRLEHFMEMVEEAAI
jgi:hypothetical protein